MFSFKGVFKNGVFRYITRIFLNFWREPSLALAGFSNANFASKENTRHVCPDPVQGFTTVRSSFGRKLYLLAQERFGREGEGTLGQKKNGPKARKTKYLVANAMHKAKYGRALNETGTAQLRRQAAHRAGASEWNYCRLLCGLLFRFLVICFTLFFT